MKDLHIKLDNGSGMILDELCKKYNATKTDIISSLLEIANNQCLNKDFANFIYKQDEDYENDRIYMELFRTDLFMAIANRQ